MRLNIRWGTKFFQKTSNSGKVEIWNFILKKIFLGIVDFRVHRIRELLNRENIL